MKIHARNILALAALAGACLGTEPAARAAGLDSAAATRDRDPGWRPATHEAYAIQLTDGRSRGSLKNFCLNAQGEILGCFAPNAPTTSRAGDGGPAVRVFTPEGKPLKSFPLPIKPAAICVAPDGAIFVAGEGRVLKLDPAGKVLASAPSPVAAVPVVITKEMEDSLKATRRFTPTEVERRKTMLAQRRADVTGLAASARDVFLAVPAPHDFTYQVYRFDQALQNPKLVVEKLRGCCGQMDIQARGDTLWIPHNGRHSVEARDRDGRELSRFGSRGKVKAEDFGGCCEPKNMRALANGDLLVAESGPPLCIKRFSSSGKFLGVVALVSGKSECLRVTVEMSPDGRSYYLLDTKRDAIRVFKAKS